MPCIALTSCLQQLGFWHEPGFNLWAITIHNPAVQQQFVIDDYSPWTLPSVACEDQLHQRFWVEETHKFLKHGVTWKIANLSLMSANEHLDVKLCNSELAKYHTELSSKTYNGLDLQKNNAASAWQRKFVTPKNRSNNHDDFTMGFTCCSNLMRRHIVSTTLTNRATINHYYHRWYRRLTNCCKDLGINRWRISIVEPCIGYLLGID